MESYHRPIPISLVVGARADRISSVTTDCRDCLLISTSLINVLTNRNFLGTIIYNVVINIYNVVKLSIALYSGQ